MRGIWGNRKWCIFESVRVLSFGMLAGAGIAIRPGVEAPSTEEGRTMCSLLFTVITCSIETTHTTHMNTGLVRYPVGVL